MKNRTKPYESLYWEGGQIPLKLNFFKASYLLFHYECVCVSDQSDEALKISCQFRMICFVLARLYFYHLVFCKSVYNISPLNKSISNI